MKKLAVLMLIHKNYEQVNLFIDQFDENLFDIFVHTDIKSQDFISNKKNVYILTDAQRVSVEWGRFSMVQAMINLLKNSFEKKYFKYIFVSGQDLLIKPSVDLYNKLIKDEKNYINFMEDKYRKKFQYRNIVRMSNFLYKQNIISKVVRRIIYKTANIYAKIKKTNYVYGSQWSILSNDFVEFLIEKNNIDPLIIFFKNKIVPDESFFQTAILNSPYKNYISDNLHYIDWEKNANNPKILVMEDIRIFEKTNKYIARKFDLNINKEIIDKVIGDKHE